MRFNKADHAAAVHTRAMWDRARAQRTRALQGPMHRWVSALWRLVDLPSDTEDEAMHKRFFLALSMGVVGISLVVVVVAALHYTEYIYSIIRMTALGFPLFVGVGMIGYITFTKGAPQRLIFIVATLSVAYFIFLDFYMSGTMRGSTWPLFLLLLDALLVFHVPVALTYAVISAGLLWLLCINMLFVVAPSIFSARSVEGNLKIPKVCDCADPPCAIPLSDTVVTFSLQVLMFVGNYHFTRHFAQEVRRGEEQMRSSIEMTQRVAVFLSRFDLDAARWHLSSSDATCTMPEQLRESLHDICENMRAYRPYLPAACFLRTRPDGSSGDDEDPDDDEDDPQRDELHASRSHGPSSSVAWSTSSVEVRSRRLKKQQGLSVASLAPTDYTSVSSMGDNPAQAGAAEAAGETIVVPSLLHTSLTSSPSPRHLRSARVTLAVTNLHNSLEAMESGEYELSFPRTLNLTISVFHSRHGVIDSLVGDRILASWNASCVCARHSCRAVAAAKFFAAEEACPCNVALVTGKALCGDIGCFQMRRFAVLGTKPLMLTVLERLGRRLGLDIVCDGACQADACSEHDIRLFPLTATLVKCSPARTVTVASMSVWEVPRVPVPHAHESFPSEEAQEEWMYVLDTHTLATTVTRGVEAFLSGASRAEAERVVAAAPFDSEEQRTAGLRELVRLLDNRYASVEPHTVLV